MSKREDRYKALRLRRVDDSAYTRIDDKRMKAPDGSILLREREEDTQDDSIVLDLGPAQEETTETSSDVPVRAKPTRRKKPAQEKRPEEQAPVHVRVEKGGMVVNAAVQMVVVTDELIVMKGKKPLAFEPQVSDEEPGGTAYNISVNGTTYACLYLGITYCETPDTQTVVIHKV